MNDSFGNLIELFEYRVKERPENILYIFLEDGENVHSEITYGELNTRAKAIAATLQETCKKGDRIILLFPNGIDFMAGLFGCILAGLIAIPAYPPRKDKSSDRFFSILKNSDASVVLASQSIQKKVSRQFNNSINLQNISFLVYEEIDLSQSTLWQNPQINDSDIAILQYTSGSTGEPKGVMLSHENILHNEKVIKDAFGHDENLTGVNWLPNFHDMGLFGTLLQPFYTGGKNVIISPAAFLRNPLNWLKAIDSYQGNTAGGPNFAFEYCLQRITEEERQGIDLSSLQVMFCGAEPIRYSTLKKFADGFAVSGFHIKQFYPCYGLAEATLMVTGGDYMQEPLKVSIDEGNEFTGCGHPWHGTKVVIADPDNMTISPPGEIGEIWISGPSVARGYWNNPEETENTFNAYLKDTGEGPFMRSGDTGFIRDGELYVTGRLKDLIIIRGTNHYPQDIELAIEEGHPALRKNAGACFSVDLAEEERLVIVNEVERTHMRELNAEEVFDAVRMKLAEDHNVLPYSIVLIRTGSIPKTSSGKIQRQACKKAYLNEELSILEEWKMKLGDGHPPDTIAFEKDSLRQWLVDWLSAQKDLDPASIDPDKPITAYGLDSLLAVNLEKEVNETFGISWPIESFLQENTINHLVEEGERLLSDKQM